MSGIFTGMSFRAVTFISSRENLGAETFTSEAISFLHVYFVDFNH